MTTCLVTGGSGFLGRRIVRRLVELGHDVTLLGRRPVPGYRTIVADLGADEIDLRDELFSDVYHVAGLAHLEPRTSDQAERFRIVNAEGTRRLLAALERSRGIPRSLLLVSSVSVYGALGGEDLDETTARHPVDPYGRSKLEAEDLVSRWGERHGVRTAIVRLPLVTGPGAPGNLGKMVAAMADGLYMGVGRGAARRSMVRRSDVAEILPQILEAGGIFHLTDGHHPSFAELETTLAAVLGRPGPRHLPMPLARAAALTGDLLETITRHRMLFNSSTLHKMTVTLTVSDEKARRALDWRPTKVLDHVDELLREQAAPKVPNLQQPAPVPSRDARAWTGVAPANREEESTTPTAVVVVSYECGPYLARCVQSVLASTVPVEVFVVDNASRDEGLAMLQDAVGGDPRVRVLRNPTNVGFAAGVNQGLALASSPFVLLLNPDSVVAADTIARMRELMEAHPDAGAAGGRVVHPDGTEQPGCRRSFPSLGPAFVRAFGLWRFGSAWRALDFVRAGQPLPPGPTDVDAISGAFMFVRQAAVEAAGPMDEAYILHCEDLDWCVRFRDAGWRVLFAPDVSVIHEQGVSSRARPLFVHWHKHRSMVRFYRKFLRQRYPAPVFALVAAGVALRFLALTPFIAARMLRERRAQARARVVPAG